MAKSIGLPEPTPEFRAKPGSTFIELLHQIDAHEQKYPSEQSKQVQNLQHPDPEIRAKAAAWIHENAAHLYKV